MNPAVFAIDRPSLSIDEISMFPSEQYKSERRKGAQRARRRVVAMNAPPVYAQIKAPSSLLRMSLPSLSTVKLSSYSAL